jgi:hypothetical protein
VADVVDHPLSDQEARQLSQAPSQKREVMIRRLGLGDLVISRRSASVKVFGRPPTFRS